RNVRPARRTGHPVMGSTADRPWRGAAAASTRLRPCRPLPTGGGHPVRALRPGAERPDRLACAARASPWPGRDRTVAGRRRGVGGGRRRDRRAASGPGGTRGDRRPFRGCVPALLGDTGTPARPRRTAEGCRWCLLASDRPDIGRRFTRLPDGVPYAAPGTTWPVTSTRRRPVATHATTRPGTVGRRS